MRPLKLTIQAFGAYSGRVEISFENLDKSSVFLISGSTGSGKTTIFDAVCFALFNESSGSYRGNNTLRSHYAPDSIKSFVEFEFIFNNKVYKIIRTPAYQRKKLKGEGLIKENANAELYLPDGKIINGVCEVDKYIIDLLGVNHSQFCQIALLAQGEFVKLLNSPTAQRSEIFRNIFNTGEFLLFQDKLKDEFSKYKNIISDIQKSIIQYVLQIKTNDEELLNLIQSFKENETLILLNEIIEKLDKINKETDKQLKKYQKDYENSDKEYKDKFAIYQKIQSKNTLLKEKIQIINEIEKQKIIFENSKKEFSKLDEKNNEIKNLQIKINELQNNKQTAEKILSLQEEYKENELKFKNLTNEKEKLNNNLQNTKIEYLRYKYFELDKLEKELNLKKTGLIELKTKYNDKNSSYNKKYDIYISSQAGILAQNLKENSPCPVCGSISHPNPAELSDDKNISKELLDDLKIELEKEQKILDELSLECNILIEKINQKENEARKYKIEINYKEEINFQNKILNMDFENEINKILKNKEENELKLNETKLLSASINAQIQALKSQIKEIDLKKIIKTHENLNSNLKNLIKEIEDISKNYDSQKSKLTSLISKNEILDKQLDEYDKINEKEIEQTEYELNKIQDKINLINSNIKNLNLIKGINDDVLLNLLSKSKDYDKNFEYYNSYKLLSDCANGNLKGKQRITFEQYIQGYYLDLVLIEANKILKTLTRSRFQFLRNKETTKTQAKTGLDIEIMDFYTYKTRSTKTLSGGESFMAALSLALGLSSTVSNMSGAKNIDILFIDEGFGTLDSQSLDTAINQIIELCINNRIIGIISHIDELKNKVQNQIKTTKTPDGSYIEVNF